MKKKRIVEVNIFLKLNLYERLINKLQPIIKIESNTNRFI
jgi:hypothetical protein